MHALHPQVAALLKEVGDTIVLPRFRTLAASQVRDKTPGDPVTIADEESEAALSESLAALLPGSAIVGEEAVSADAAVLDRLGHGSVWLIDPIDGTANFAAGQPPFAIMVALLADGVTQAGWIYDPLSGRLCHAVKGAGAWIDGVPLVSRGSGSERLLGGISTLFLPSAERDAIERRAAGKIDLVPIPRCAGEQYPRIALGGNDLALFERTLPWDHAPGVLILEEAGGVVRRLDGSPYVPTDGRKGMMAAASHQIWDEAARVLFR